MKVENRVKLVQEIERKVVTLPAFANILTFKDKLTNSYVLLVPLSPSYNL